VLVAIASNAPDLVLLDWMLPGLSGVEMARRPRREDVIAQIPIIYRVKGRHVRHIRIDQYTS